MCKRTLLFYVITGVVLILWSGCAGTKFPKIMKEYISPSQKMAIVHFSGTKVIASAPGENTVGGFGGLKLFTPEDEPVGYDLVNEGYDIFVNIFDKHQYFEVLSKESLLANHHSQLEEVGSKSGVKEQLVVPDSMFLIFDYNVEPGKLAEKLGVDNVIFIYSSFSLQEAQKTSQEEFVGGLLGKLSGTIVDIDVYPGSHVRIEITLKMFNRTGLLVWHDYIYAWSLEKVSTPDVKSGLLGEARYHTYKNKEEVTKLYRDVIKRGANFLLKRLEANT